MADFAPTHPGDVLLEDFLKPMGLSQYALAKALRLPRTHISRIVHGKRAITPDIAIRLAHFFGTSAEFWTGMQATYDLDLARAGKREGFHREALAAWDDYQRTGLHLTLEEVDAWLATWGTDAETDPPDCHQ